MRWLRLPYCGREGGCREGRDACCRADYSGVGCLDCARNPSGGADVSRYSQEHYEDVARIFAQYPRGLHDGVVKDFADLFAADSPPSSRCWNCGDSKDALEHICTRPNEGHRFGGFDRDPFLTACGLEPTCPLCSCPSENGDVHLTCADQEQACSDYVAGKMAGEFD